MQPTENALVVLEKRYFLPGENWDGLCKRVAKAVANGDVELESKYFEAINNFYFLPNSPALMNGGTSIKNLSACFVLRISDSMESIMDTAKDMSLVFKSGGGVGIDISKLRESGSMVMETNGVASGAVSFMEIYNTVANVTKQGGKRRAALMGVMRVDHPEILDFIRVKNDRSKLNNFNLSVAVTDKFMKAAEKGENYDLISPKNGKVGELNAREVFQLIAQNAWENGEPGLLFIDTINRCNPIPQFGKISATNPCVHGDTLIAVADGRGSVPISQLAEEGLDVPVYCSNDNGNVCIKMMRNPRITGYNQKLLRVNIEDGLSIVVTENHKLKLNDGRYVEAKDLSAGDSLSIATIFDARMQDIFVGSNSKSQKYRWINDGKRKYNKSEHRMIYEFFNDCKIPSGSVIHHLDYNGLNNNIENLACMTKSEHDNLHRQDKIGKNNPYFKMSPESLMRFKNAPRDGENNANFSGVSHDKIFDHAKLLTMELGKRFSKKEWIEYAQRNNIPQSFSKYRKNVFVDIRTLSIMAAIECGLEHCNIDQRIVKTYNMAMKDGYNAKIENGTIVVSRICEMCGNSFDVPYSRRETSFCGRKCSCKYLLKKDIREVARISMLKTYKDKLEITKSNQLDVFTRLRFELGRTPLKKEWESACRKANIPIRFGSKFGFSGYKELKRCGEFHNHRVISVAECGYGTVYTGTVDDFHNFYSTFESKIDGKSLCVNNLQCGEIPLLENEACNLLSINLKKLNTFEEIETTVRLGVRFLNGVLDVSTFPTESITKQVAITKKIGLGVMGWADYLAERMIPYDSKKARTEASELMANIEQCAHDESVKIANERNEYIETTMGKRRNGTLLCIAPTGTISMIADCSSSIEPYFALSYTKNVMDGQSLRYINDVLVRKLKEENLWCSEVKSQILKTGSIQHIDTIPDRIKCVFKTANEISIRGHIEMQAAFQKHVDNSISKTINLSSEATVNDVMLAYLDAYRLGVKGITIYRDGSRSGQVLTSPKARIEKCPECQSKSISHDSGCVTCQSCGWSICSI